MPRSAQGSILGNMFIFGSKLPLGVLSDAQCQEPSRREGRMIKKDLRERFEPELSKKSTDSLLTKRLPATVPDESPRISITTGS